MRLYVFFQSPKNTFFLLKCECEYVCVSVETPCFKGNTAKKLKKRHLESTLHLGLHLYFMSQHLLNLGLFQRRCITYCDFIKIVF